MGEFPPGQQHFVRAGFAFQPNIRAQAHNPPCEPAAWMRLAQFHPVGSMLPL